MRPHIDRHLFTDKRMSKLEAVGWSVAALLFVAVCLLLMLSYFDVLTQ